MNNGVVIAGLPLALLEAVQDHDRPGEVLEEEDLTVSLPRRLGLKGVVLSQIQRYESAHASNRMVPAAEVDNLLRLVLRRPDAEMILRDTGRRVARFRFERRSRPGLTALRALPRSLRLIGIRRAARRLMRAIAGNGGAELRGKPLVLALRESPARDFGPAACVLYTGALEEMLLLYERKPHAVVHSRCTARGDEICEWSALVDGTPP